MSGQNILTISRRFIRILRGGYWKKQIGNVEKIHQWRSCHFALLTHWSTLRVSKWLRPSLREASGQDWMAFLTISCIVCEKSLVGLE